MTEHLSSITVDALLIGALTPEAKTQAESHLGTCLDCTRELESQKRSHETFRREVLPRTLPKIMDAVTPQPNRSQSSSFSLLWMVAPVLAMLLVFMFPAGRTLFSSPKMVTPAEPPDVQVKGTPSLQVYAQHGDKVFPVESATRLEPGDEVRFAVGSGAFPYLLIASIDSAGKASVYFPFDGNESRRIDVNQRIELPGSVRLDGTLGPERLFALFSELPLKATAVTAELRRIGAGGPQAIRKTTGLQTDAAAQATLLIEKSAQ